MSQAAEAALESKSPGAQSAAPVRHHPSLDFSLTGIVYCGMMLFMGLAAINSQANLLFGVFGLMIGVLLVAGVISRLVLKKLKLQRVFPDHGVVGATLRVTYRFTNQKRYWPSLSVSLAELDATEAFVRQPQCYLLHAAAGMTADVPAELLPKRRGVHELHRIQLSTSFPFGFIKRAAMQRHKDHLVVYPAVGQVDPRLLAMCRSAELAGTNMRPRPGGMDEFYGVKEYRNGDSPRWIYWRRSARTGVLVSKEMTQVAPPRVVLLVDTHLHDRSAASHRRVEKAIAMAASVAANALDEGLSVGLFAWSKEWLAIAPTRGKQQRDDILSALGRLSLNVGAPLTDLLDGAHVLLKTGTTPILFTPSDVQLGLGEGNRGRMVVISSESSTAEGWFRFDPTIDFTGCMPFEQQPGLAAASTPTPPPSGARIQAAVAVDPKPISTLR